MPIIQGLFCEVLAFIGQAEKVIPATTAQAETTVISPGRL